jgi:hypothetical protein
MGEVCRSAFGNAPVMGRNRICARFSFLRISAALVKWGPSRKTDAGTADAVMGILDFQERMP